jgi:hypothetical protein
MRQIFLFLAASIILAVTIFAPTTTQEPMHIPIILAGTAGGLLAYLFFRRKRAS